MLSIQSVYLLTVIRYAYDYNAIHSGFLGHILFLGHCPGFFENQALYGFSTLQPDDLKQFQKIITELHFYMLN